MPEKCFSFDCGEPGDKRVRYCRETHVPAYPGDEYEAGKGKDIWYCEGCWAALYGTLSEDEVTQLTRAEHISRSLSLAKQILWPT